MTDDKPNQYASNTDKSIQNRFCHKCGNPLTPGAAFCSRCGTRVETPVGHNDGKSPVISLNDTSALNVETRFDDEAKPKWPYIIVGIVLIVLLACFFWIKPNSVEKNTNIEPTMSSGVDEDAVDTDNPSSVSSNTTMMNKPIEVIVEVESQQESSIRTVAGEKEYIEEKQINKKDKGLDNAAMSGHVNVTEGVEDLNKTRIIDQVIAEEKPVEDVKVYNLTMVEQQPEFPGGIEAMYQYLRDQIVYPVIAAEEGVQGKVIVEFVVSKTGAVENVRVLRGRHPALDKEALRVVNAMPQWKPARNNGEPVNCSYSLPVSFRLSH